MLITPLFPTHSVTRPPILFASLQNVTGSVCISFIHWSSFQFMDSKWLWRVVSLYLHQDAASNNHWKEKGWILLPPRPPSPLPQPSTQPHNFLPLILKQTCHLRSLISACPPELCALVERSCTCWCTHTLPCTYTHTHTCALPPPLSLSQAKSCSVQLVEHEKKMSQMADPVLEWVQPPRVSPPPRCPETTQTHRRWQEFTAEAEDRGQRTEDRGQGGTGAAERTRLCWRRKSGTTGNLSVLNIVNNRFHYSRTAAESPESWFYLYMCLFELFT